MLTHLVAAFCFRIVRYIKNAFRSLEWLNCL